MKSSDKAFIQGYNAQAVVDTESQIIVGYGLTNEAGDVRQMAPLVREVERATGRRPREVLADACLQRAGGLLEREERTVLD